MLGGGAILRRCARLQDCENCENNRNLRMQSHTRTGLRLVSEHSTFGTLTEPDLSESVSNSCSEYVGGCGDAGTPNSSSRRPVFWVSLGLVSRCSHLQVSSSTASEVYLHPDE